MPGARCTRGRVCSVESTRVSNHRYAAINRHSLRDGFTTYVVLSPGTGLFCPRRSRDHPATLMPASGHQDHTPSPSAPVSLVLRHCRVHRIPLPTSVTTAKRPSCGSGTAGRIHNFCFSEREIFARGQLTTRISLNRLTKLVFARTHFSAV